MRIETLTVKLLRSGESYTNDSTEIRVALDDGDDWKRIEQELRINAEALIDLHWEKKREAEQAEYQRQKEEREKREAAMRDARDAYLKEAADDYDCEKCPGVGDACYGCEHEQPF